MPVVKLDYTNTKIQDTYVDSGNPTINYNSFTGNNIGKGVVAGTGLHHTFIKFDLGLLPNDVVINTATLTFKTSTSANVPDVKFHKVLSDWDDTTMVWNNKPQFESAPFLTLPNPGGSTTWNIDIKSLVQKWVKEGNFGLAMTSDLATDYLQVFAANHGTIGNRPTLTIDYSIPTEDKKQVEFVNSNYQAPNNAATVNNSLPTGIQKGDTLLTFVNYTSVTSDAIQSSGWTTLFKGAYSGSNIRYAVLHKIAEGNDVSSITFNSDVVNIVTGNHVYRNVKEVIFKNAVFASTSLPSPNPLTVQSNSFLLIANFAAVANFPLTATLNFMELSELGLNARAIQMQGTYTYKKTNYTSEEMRAQSGAGASWFGTIALELISITNLPPKIDGQDEHLGTINAPLLKAYSVTDTEGDTITITEKVNGTVLRIYEGTGAQTLDLSTVWANLAVGKHTITIEANDTYDTTRKSVRTWTFLKILNPNDDLVTAVEGLGDLEAIVDSWKQALVDKVGGSATDTFEDIIEGTELGKRYIKGTSNRSASAATFLNYSGSSYSHYYLAITGLPFRPSKVIIYNSNGTTSTAIDTDNPQYSGFNLILLEGYTYGIRLTGNAEITSNGFQLPVSNVNGPFNWIAIE